MIYREDDDKPDWFLEDTVVHAEDGPGEVDAPKHHLPETSVLRHLQVHTPRAADPDANDPRDRAEAQRRPRHDQQSGAVPSNANQRSAGLRTCSDI